MKKERSALSTAGTGIFTIVGIVYILPILIVLMNSFKKKVYINKQPFQLPDGKTMAGLENYMTAIDKYNLLSAVGWTVFITVGSVLVILVCTSMCAWYIVRVNGVLSKILYYLFIFSMVVPFQMVMFTMSKLANMTHLNNPPGMVLLYLGFGSGLSVFMFCGFIKSIPLDIEEAAMIDGCNPLQTFFGVVMPILKPTAITVAILNAMWIWNDYLLPYLVIGLSTNYKTIPVVVQYLVGSYGAKDLGAMMALLVLSVIPIIVFYLTCQKYIIEGVVAGAVKG